MSVVKDLMTNKITLHGLGFIQVQMPGNQRIHVWHPDLPRRSSYPHCAIHDHRFGFTSRVMVGFLRNIVYDTISPADRTHPEALKCNYYNTFLHEGERTAAGNRPWQQDDRIPLIEIENYIVGPGQEYEMPAYVYHQTIPQGDGIVATLMLKMWEGDKGAHSTCDPFHSPDIDFDRFQWSESDLWEVFMAVMKRAV